MSRKIPWPMGAMRWMLPFFAALCLSGPASAAVVYVNKLATGAEDGKSWATAFHTLQAAVTAANVNDELWVAGATYPEHVTITKALSLYGGFAGTEADRASRNPADNVTTVDGTSTSTVLTLTTTTETVVIDGFTITRGTWGIDANSVPLVLRNNVITRNSNGVSASKAVAIDGNTVVDNTSTYGLSLAGSPTVTSNTVTGNGYGLYLTGSPISVSGNTVSSNRNTGIVASVNSGVATTISNNIVSHNADTGLEVNGGSIRVLNNVLNGNSTTSNGGGIRVDGGSPDIANNVLRSNTATALGGGIYLAASSTTSILKVINNTIVGNAAGASGGGIAMQGGTASGSTVTLANNLVAYNSSGIAQVGVVNATLSHNDVFGNAADFQGVADPTGSAGNLSVDPQLAAPVTRNVHIQASSPLRDVGDNTVVQAGWTDMDTEPRIQGTTVDIGADESNGATYSIPPIIVRVSPSGDDANDGSTWALAKKTVQAGVDAAAGGGEVWVAAGTYEEQVTIADNVTLLGGFAGTETSSMARDPAANPTIISGGSSSTSTTIDIPAGTGATVTIDGLTVRHDTKVGNGLHAATAALVLRNDTFTSNSLGITVSNSLVTITNCKITGNSTGLSGSMSGKVLGTLIDSNSSWGVDLNSSSGLFEANQFTHNGNAASVSGAVTFNNNQITDSTSSYGLSLSGSPTVTNNTITGNGYAISMTGITVASVTGNTVAFNRNTGLYASATGTSQVLIAGNQVTNNGDSGIELNGGPIQVLNNIIRNNSTTTNGGGIQVDGGSPVIANNVVAGNSAGSLGGGIYVGAIATSADVKLINNTVAGNASMNDGGGVFVQGGTTSGGTVLLANSAIAYNTVGVGLSGVATLTLSHNDVFGNATGYQGLADPTGSAGNLSVDPQLAAPVTRNVHIQASSPLRDAGDNTVVQPGWTDMDTEPRIQGTTVDIGADESNGATYSIPPIIVRVSPSGDDANDGSTWALAKKTVQAGVDAAAGGGEVWVAAGTYAEYVTLGNSVSLYGGFTGSEANLSQRDPVANVTVLDGGSTASTNVITVPAGTGATETIDGFTIRHTNKVGNGILGNSAALIVRNCVVSGNSVAISVTYSILTLSNSRLTANSTGLSGSFGGSVTNNTIDANTSWGIDANNTPALFQGNTIANNGNGVSASGSPRLNSNTVRDNTSSYGLSLSGTPTVTNNTITGNGYALSITGATGTTITGNTISNNRDTGIYISQASSAPALIANNQVTNNADTGIEVNGGAIQVLNNVIRGNSTSDDGGGILVDGGSPTFASNLIVGNTAASDGGGIYLSLSATSNSVKAINNTVSGNSAGEAGAGIYVLGGTTTGGSALLSNNIIAFNNSGVVQSKVAALTLRSNDVFGNGANYLGLADPTGTGGNISADPLFAAGPFRDLHIQPTSPARNAGSSTDVLAGWTDIDGEPRVEGLAVDIGADESNGTAYTIPPSIVRVSPSGSDANSGGNWSLAKKTVQAAVTAAGIGGEVWVAAGTYPEQVTVRTPMSILGGFNGTEAQASQRDTVANAVVINGGAVTGTTGTITIPAGVGGIVTIDGLTIRHQGKTGYGVYGTEAALVLRNDTLLDNSSGVSLTNGILDVSGSQFTGNATGLNGSFGGSVVSNTFSGNSSWGMDVTTPHIEVRQNVFNQNANGASVSGPGNIANNQVTNNTSSYGFSLSGAQTVANNTITGNGYGLSMTGSGAIAVTGNTISNNRNTGFYISQSGSTPMPATNNTVTQNAGGGVEINGGTVYLMNNMVTGNRATVDGGGIRISGGSPLVANNIVAGNQTTARGGGVFVELSATTASPKLINNTIASNTSLTSGAAGGVQIHGGTTSGGTLTVVNTIVAYNALGVVLDGKGTVTFRNSDVYGNTSANWLGLPDPTGTDGNLVVDPKFANQSGGDYHLTTTSPVIDAGDDTVVQAGWTDIDGDLRILGAHVDIGADEALGSSQYTTADVIRALRLAGGLSQADTNDIARLDVAPKPGTGGRAVGDGAVTLLDALRFARELGGKEPSFP